jgi:hypothetical protein
MEISFIMYLIIVVIILVNLKSSEEDKESKVNTDLMHTMMVFDDEGKFLEKKADKLFDIITNDSKHCRKKFIAFIEHHSLNGSSTLGVEFAP